MPTKGHSTTLGYANLPLGGTPTYTPVAKVVELKPNTPEAESVDVSTMESPEQWEEVTAGWSSAGEVEATLQYSKADTATLFGIFKQDKGYCITFSDGSKWACQGFMSKFGHDVERKGIIQTTVSIKLSGKPTFTPGA